MSMMKNKEKKNGRRITISRSFLRWLFLIVFLGFLVSMQFIWLHQTNMSRKNALSLLRINIQDVRQDVIDASDENLLKLTRSIADEINAGALTDSNGLKRLMEEFDVAEINVINADGIITATTLEEFQDYDMRNGEQSAEFMSLLEETETEYVQSYQPTSHDPDLS